MVDTTDGYGSRYSGWSRRRLLQSTAGGAAVFAAGCLDGDSDDESGGDDSNDDDTGGEGRIQRTLVDGDHHWMDDAELNPYAADPTGGAIWRLFPALALYATDATFYEGGEEVETVSYGEFRPGSAVDWEHDGTEMRITLRDDWQWNSGDEVTATDLVTRLRLDGHDDAEIWEFLDQVYEDGEKTAVLEYNREVDPELIEHTLFNPGMTVNAPPEINGEQTIFGETLEALEEASTEDEQEDLLTELMEFNWAPDDDDLALAGPYSVVNVTRNTIILEPNDGFWNPVNFDELELKTVGLGGTAAAEQEVLTDSTDLGPILTPEMAEGMDPDLEMAVKQGDFGIGLGLNYEHPDREHYSDRNFRRAIAYVLNPENVAQGSNPLLYGLPEYSETCIINNQQAEDILGEHLEDFERYAEDVDRAAELMEAAGFERDGDEWVDEDGEPVVMDIASTGWDGYPEIGQMVAQAIEDFGIDVDYQVMDDGQYVNMLFEEDDELDAAFFTWGAAHPYEAFTEQFGQGNYWNVPEELEVPMPVGDPDGDLETVNVRERTLEIPDLTDEELEETLVELSWAFNQNLPIIPLVSENMGVTYWTDEWGYPDREDAIWGIERQQEKLCAYGLITAQE